MKRILQLKLILILFTSIVSAQKPLSSTNGNQEPKKSVKNQTIKKKNKWEDAYDWVYGCSFQILREVRKNGKHGVVKNKKLIVPLIYEEIEISDSEPHIHTKLNGKWGLVDLDGYVIAECDNDEIIHWEGGSVSVIKNKKERLVFYSGKTISSPHYFDTIFLGNIREGMVLVKNNGRFGFIDTERSTLIPCIYESCNSFKNGQTDVVLNGKKISINKKGVCIIGCQ